MEGEINEVKVMREKVVKVDAVSAKTVSVNVKKSIGCLDALNDDSQRPPHKRSDSMLVDGRADGEELERVVRLRRRPGFAGVE